MAIRFDVVPPADRGQGGGPRPLLRARIDEGPRRPALRIEHAVGRHLRVVCEGRVLFWARVKSWYEGVWLLASQQSGRPALPCPPIGMDEVRAVKAAPGSEAWREAWARHFALALTSSPAGLFHPGDWEIADSETKLRDPRRSVADAHGLIDVHGVPGAVFESWQLNGSNATIPLRPWSNEDASRVKALRKLARAGTLPPLLLWFVSGLDMHLLLDGHDRAHAARLEGVHVPRLVIAATRTQTWEVDERAQAGELERATVNLARAATIPGGMRGYQLDIINSKLVQAFSAGRSVYARTRAYPIPGGDAAWRAEVVARLAEAGAPATKADGTEHEMLHG